MIYTASSPFTSRFQTVKMSKPASVRYPLQGNLALFGRSEVQYPAAGNEYCIAQCSTRYWFSRQSPAGHAGMYA